MDESLTKLNRTEKVFFLTPILDYLLFPNLLFYCFQIMPRLKTERRLNWLLDAVGRKVCAQPNLQFMAAYCSFKILFALTNKLYLA